MKKLFLCLVLILSLNELASAASRETKTFGDGFIEWREDYPVLHLKGTEYDMGVQYGYLAGDQVKANIENLKKIGEGEQPLVRYLPDRVFTYLRKIIGFVFWWTFPSNVRTHIKGMVAGASQAGVDLNRFDVAFVNSVIDIVGIAGASTGELPIPGGKLGDNFLIRALGLKKFLQQCDSFAAWGARTKDGKTFQTRNTDIGTGAGIERYPMIIVYKPRGKIPFITASFSGMVGIFTGMNAFGVSLGQVWAFSKDVKVRTPWQITIRKIFSEVTTARAAHDALEDIGVTTYGNNFVIADAGGHSDPSETGFAIEMTAKRFSSFKENDQRELLPQYNGVSYGLPIPNAVARGDLSLDLKIRARQLSAAGPDGDAADSNSYKERYKGQIDMILDYENRGILIGHEEAEEISRVTAMDKSSLQVSVYANTDRDFWVAYSKILEDNSVIQAFQRKYVNIPFYTYLVDLEQNFGTVKIKNWFKTKNNLKLVHLGKNKELLKETQVSLQANSEAELPDVYLERGEALEVYSKNKLIDRVVRN